MAKNEFLPFGTAGGANVLTPTAYGQLAARGVGFATGVAKSKELNTVWRQASVIAATVAQFIANHSGDNVLDDGNMAKLQASLEKALQAKIDDSGFAKKDQTERQIRLASGSATHWLKIATMVPVVNSEARLEIELSGMSDYGVNATAMAVDRVYITTRGTSPSARVTAATVGNLIQQFSLGRSIDTQNYLVGVTEEISGGNTTKYNFWLKMSNHTGISSTMSILNNQYSGVTVISDFSGTNNNATEPAGIVYAIRQQFFTTANPQQAADVRNNAAARMGVARVLTGATGPSSPGVWSVENSTWAGVPWGSVICTTNGSDLSTAGGSGRFNHYLQISHEAGGQPGLRVAVNINGVASGWDRVMMASGGTFNGEVQSTSGNILRGIQGGYGAILRMDANGLYFLQTNKNDPNGNYNANRSVTIAHDNGAVTIGTPFTVNNASEFITKTGVNNWTDSAGNHNQTNGLRLKGNGNLVADIALHEFVNNYLALTFHVYGTGGDDGWFDMRAPGHFLIGGGDPQLYVGNAKMAGDGNIWGTRWNSNGQWLWDAIMDQIRGIGQLSVSGNQWWAKINLNGGTLIVQGGYAEVRDAEVTDRIPLNIALPHQLLHVSIVNRNFAQGYATYNPQVTVLSQDSTGFNFVHGQKERMIYWMAVGY